MSNHKIKRLPLLLILLLSLPQISYAIQFGAGTGTSYPSSLDTSFLLTNKSGGACVQSASSSKACSETINDIQSAVISLQTSLGIGSLYSTAHTWTANQTISNTAPSLIFTDTTASAKSLTIAVDANLAQLRESAGAANSLLTLDLANNRVGIVQNLAVGENSSDYFNIYGLGNTTKALSTDTSSPTIFSHIGAPVTDNGTNSRGQIRQMDIRSVASNTSTQISGDAIWMRAFGSNATNAVLVGSEIHLEDNRSGTPTGNTQTVLELTLSSKVAPLANLSSIGLITRSGDSPTGTPATAVRQGTAILIDGNRGWANGIYYRDTDNATNLFSVDQIGAVTAKTSLALGVAGTTLGVLTLSGNTSGTVSMQTAAAAGTWTWTVPTSGGTSGYAMTTNGSGVSSWAQLSLTAGVTGILPTANGGTGIAYFTAAGPTAARIYTFPDVATTVLTTNAAVTAAQGGTGVANGASSTLTLPNAATTISTGGTIALGGFTLTVPATGTTALLATANAFSTNQTVNANSGALPASLNTSLLALGGADGTTPDVPFDAFGGNAILSFRRANNTNASRTALAANDQILNIRGLGYGATGYSAAARLRIQGFAAEAWTDTAQGTYIAFATTPKLGTTAAERVRISDAGFVSIGTTADGATLLDLLGADNTTVQTIKINATQANITAADVFMDFRSTTGSEATIAGTAVAGVIAYNTFTGSHYTQIDDRDGLEVGMLLEAVGDKTGEWAEKVVDELIPEKRSKNDKGEDVVEPARIEQHRYKASSKPHLVKSRISKTKGTQAAYGVYGGTDKEGRDMVFALGSGPCMVAKTKKNVAIGDYLISSDVPGAMELQADGVYRNGTVAKAMEPITWAQGEVVRSGVACIYLGG